MALGTKPQTRKLEYPKDLKEKAFYQWYDSGCPRGEKALVECFEPYNGHKPSYDIIRHWMSELNWPARVEALDADVSVRMDRVVIDNRIKMFSQHAEEAAKLREKAYAYLKEHDPDSSSVALKQWVEALGVERSSRGLGDTLAHLNTLTDDQLLKEIKKLSSGEKDKDEEVLNADIMDAETESES